MQTLKQNLYSNCKVLNIDGQHLFNCSVKKTKWYLRKGLATVVQESPLVIQLNFQTNGNGHIGDPFYLQERKNICVVCGAGGDITRHHVVPICYRKFFPANIKSRSHYDILPMCYECHEKYEIHANDYKNRLAGEFGVTKVESVFDKELATIKSYASALLKYKDEIPANRVCELEAALLKHLGKEILTNEDIESIAKVEYMTHPEKTEANYIIEKIDDIYQFVVGWREHFISITEAAYMPEHWDMYRALDIAKGIEGEDY